MYKTFTVYFAVIQVKSPTGRYFVPKISQYGSSQEGRQSSKRQVPRPNPTSALSQRRMATSAFSTYFHGLEPYPNGSSPN